MKKFPVVMEFLVVYGWAILVVIVAIGALAYFGVLKQPTQYFCELEPDKCVCEEYETLCEKLAFDYDTCIQSIKVTNKNGDIVCSKYRKLTERELLEKDCNENPREDENCVCEKYKTETILQSIRYYYDNITFYHCIESIITNINIEDWTLINDKYLIGEVGIEIQKYPLLILNSEKCKDFVNFIYKDIEIECIKSHPKTECEKGNIDFIEEELIAYCDGIR